MEGSSIAEPSGSGSAAQRTLLGPGDRPPVIAFLADGESENTLREALTEAGADGFDIRRGDLTTASKHLAREATPLVLVVDITGLDQPLTALDQLAELCEPDVRVLVVGDRNDLAFYRELTRGLGVSEYLFKPLTKEFVARHFVPHIVPGAKVVDPRLRGGRVVTVSGVRGGVGATTLAANLAVHLAAETRRHVALVDLNLHTGSAALMLGAKAGTGLRVAIEAPEKIDQLFLDRAAVPINDRLSLFSAEEGLTESPVPVANAPHRLLELLRARFNFVVVDLPHLPGRMQRAAFDLAHQRVLVMAPDLANVRDLLRFHALPNAPTQSRRAVVVLNHAGLPGALTRKQVEEGLEFAIDVAVPHLPRILPHAADLGEPAVTKRGPFRSAIIELAREVAAIRTQEETTAKRGLFGRFRR